jgi:release factor glutamine methyltransferase
MLGRAEFVERCREAFTADEIQAFWMWFSAHSFSDHQEYYHKLERLLLGEPVQYIFQSAPFHRYEYRVGPGCLIPRPETEELVALILQKPEIQSLEQWLDIGTGSGCIALTLAQERPWNIKAIDISSEALHWAQLNWKHCPKEVQERVQLLDSDFLSWNKWPEGIQAIVSNPPYIATEEKPKIKDRVDKWEPQTALYSPNDPLLFYRKMAELCTNNASELWLFLEINQELAEETNSVFTEIGCQTKKIADLSGNLRFIQAFWPGK